MSAAPEEDVLHDLDFSLPCWREDGPADWARITECGEVGLMCNPCMNAFVARAYRMFELGGIFACRKCGFLARNVEQIWEHDRLAPL